MTEEQIVGLIIIGGLIVLFVILGIVLMMGKGAFLIAGYNTLPEEEKKKYDTNSLTKFVGKSILALSFTMLFWLASIFFDISWLFHVGTVLFIGIVIFMIVYMNTGNRYKSEK